MDKTELRKKSLEEIDRVKWIPSWGRERIYGMIENRPDWCVSRQRAWGVPITVFYCKKCEALHMTEELSEHIYALFKEHGADIWFSKDTEDLIPAKTVCQNCGHHGFKKETDILDVWFDSGVSHAAVLERRSNLKWPADLYLEGSDQHRGWFHSSLLTAVGTRGRAPYKSVLTHGFVVDENGKKMSKSLGNVIAPKKVIDKYGAEILRLWVSASDYRDDIRISDNILRQLSDAYRRIRNTSRFMLGNLNDFDPTKDAVDYADMLDIDRFALHKLQKLIQKAVKAYESYDFHIIYHALHNYCTLDLSAFYLDILKDRLYTSPPESQERRSAQTALHIILDAIIRLIAPVLPFTTEEVWKFMPRQQKETSVHLSNMPVVDKELMDAVLAKKWERLLDIRREVTRALEEARATKQIGHSLDASVSICAEEEPFELLHSFSDELRSIFIVSEAVLFKSEKLDETYKSSDVEGVSIRISPAEGEKCERCWVHGSEVGLNSEHPTICNRCLDALDKISPEV